MNEEELWTWIFQAVIENGASSLVIVLALIGWAKSKYKTFRDDLIEDLTAAIHEDLASVKAELSRHGESLESTADEVRELRGEVDALDVRKREHSDQLRRARDRIARLEGKLGITDTDTNLQAPRGPQV